MSQMIFFVCTCTQKTSVQSFSNFLVKDPVRANVVFISSDEVVFMSNNFRILHVDTVLEKNLVLLSLELVLLVNENF